MIEVHLLLRLPLPRPRAGAHIGRHHRVNVLRVLLVVVQVERAQRPQPAEPRWHCARDLVQAEREDLDGRAPVPPRGSEE